MHPHSKEGLFSTNTFPMLSRSSIKRPFSMSTERERPFGPGPWESPTAGSSQRGPFRSRSKTIHADSFFTNFQPLDLIGQSNIFSQSEHTDLRPSLKSLIESRRKLSQEEDEDKHKSARLDKPFIDEEMDDEEVDGLMLEETTDTPGFVSNSSGSKYHKHQSCMLTSTPTTASSVLTTFYPSTTKFDFLEREARFNDCKFERSKFDHFFKPIKVDKEEEDEVVDIEVDEKPESPIEDGWLVPGTQLPTHTTSRLALQTIESQWPPHSSPLATTSLSQSSSSKCLLESSPAPSTQAICNTPATPSSVPVHIPTSAEKAQFQRSLTSARNLVFHCRTGLPLTSSPAPIRKSGTSFDFDSSITNVRSVKKALFEKDPDSLENGSFGSDSDSPQFRSTLSQSAPTTTTGLLGNFEESVLNGRLEPASIVHGFTAEIGASGSFCPSHKTLPVTVFFYTLQDTDKCEKMSSPYLGHINLGPKGYHVPRQGTVQVTLFNPNRTVVKMFVVRYDLSDMPPNSRTFMRQRTLFMPSDANDHHPESRKWLRYLIHLRFQSSKSGRIRLHTDLRILVFRKHDLDVATLNGGVPYELRSFIQMPSNPKYSKNIGKH